MAKSILEILQEAKARLDEKDLEATHELLEEAIKECAGCPEEKGIKRADFDLLYAMFVCHIDDPDCQELMERAKQRFEQLLVSFGSPEPGAPKNNPTTTSPAEKVSFFEYNLDNIYKNLIQAEYHAKNIKSHLLSPGHFSCILKHLTFVEAEAEEIISHCEIDAPEKCKFFRGFLGRLKEFRNKLKREGADEATQHRITQLRKEIESQFPELDTSKCKLCAKELG